jgi:hypothetical protein
MKKIFMVFLTCVVLQAAAAQESASSTEQGPSRLGLTLGAAVTLSDVADKVMPGIRADLTFDKMLGGLHLYGNVYDKVLVDDTVDLMRQTQTTSAHCFSLNEKKDVIEFDFGDRRKTDHFAVQIENKGKKGPWGTAGISIDTLTKVLPA